MSHPLSLRFRRPEVKDRLQAEAKVQGISASALAEELIDEGLRLRRHPFIVFRRGPAGRRAALVDGPDVWEVIGGLIGGDVPVDQRITRAVEVFGLRREQVEAALDYYTEFTDEIDEWIAENTREADEAERLWHHRRDLLSR